MTSPIDELRKVRQSRVYRGAGDRRAAWRNCSKWRNGPAARRTPSRGISS